MIGRGRYGGIYSDHSVRGDNYRPRYGDLPRHPIERPFTPIRDDTRLIDEDDKIAAYGQACDIVCDRNQFLCFSTCDCIDIAHR